MNDGSAGTALYGTEAVAAPAARRQLAAPGSGAPPGALQTLIEKLETLIEHETSLLRAHGVIDLKDSNFKKSQALLDLTRALRVFEKIPMQSAVKRRLELLGAKLGENRAVLKMHVEAMREITSIMADAVRGEDCDGTYARPIGRRGPAP